MIMTIIQLTFQSQQANATGTYWTEMQSLVPLMGPLHTSLNACVDICEVYHPFMKYIYEQLFPGCQLAKNPKPWRILLPEIIYGGWTIDIEGIARRLLYRRLDARCDNFRIQDGRHKRAKSSTDLSNIGK